MPVIISKAIKNKIKEPAMANDPTSIPMMSRMEFPTKRKTIISKKETKVAFSECMCPTFLRTSMTTGIDPMISITANRIIVTVNISLMLKDMIQEYQIKFLQRKHILSQ
jgi:hypothetical protein